MNRGDSCGSGNSSTQKGGTGTGSKSKRCPQYTPVLRPPVTVPEGTGCQAARGILRLVLSLPDRMDLKEHLIKTPPGVVTHRHLYWLPVLRPTGWYVFVQTLETFDAYPMPHSCTISWVLLDFI